MTLPNFLIIGAAKSGTTAIYTYLKQHPEIYMSPRKELRYFSNITPPPEDVPKDYIHESVQTLEAYERYFDGVTDERIYGESSPMYLYTPGTAERIKTTLPDVKLFAILRNPVERAFSAYTHGLREWKEPAGTFEEALAREPERIQAGWGMLWHYTQAGFYYQQLQRYYKVFAREQIMVVLHDDLVADASQLMRAMFAFLEVDPDFKPDTSAHPNVSGFPRSESLHRWMRKVFVEDNLLQRLSRKLFPMAFRQKIIQQVRALNLEKRQMPDDIRGQLQALFREDTEKLENLIERDLAHWLA